MNRISYRIAIAAAALLLPAAAEAAGMLNTSSCEKIPADMQVRVDLLDDAAPMLAVREALVTALTRRGIGISESSPYVLSLETEATRLGERHKGRDLGSISDGTDQDVTVRMNLWSNSSDSVLGGRKDTVLSEARDEIRVTIAINSRTDGRCIWRGDAVHETAGADQWATAKKLAPVLVDAIGSNGRRPFDLY